MIGLNRIRRARRLGLGLHRCDALLLLRQFREPGEKHRALRLLLPLLVAQRGQLSTALRKAGPELFAPLCPFGLLGLCDGIALGQVLLRAVELGARLLQRRLQVADILSRRLE